MKTFKHILLCIRVEIMKKVSVNSQEHADCFDHALTTMDIMMALKCLTY